MSDYEKRLDGLGDKLFMASLNVMETDELLSIARALLAENKRLREGAKQIHDRIAPGSAPSTDGHNCIRAAIRALLEEGSDDHVCGKPIKHDCPKCGLNAEQGE